MKKSWSPWEKILLIALLIVAGCWFVYDRSIANDQLLIQTQKLQQQLAERERELSASKARIVELERELLAGKEQEKQSFEGVLEETNKVVIDGWQQLLDTVNQELGKARNEVKDVLEKLKQEESDQDTTEKLKNENDSLSSNKEHET